MDDLMSLSQLMEITTGQPKPPDSKPGGIAPSTALSEMEVAMMVARFGAEPWPGYYDRDDYDAFFKSACVSCGDVRYVKTSLGGVAMEPCPDCTSIGASTSRRNAYAELPEPMRGWTFDTLTQRGRSFEYVRLECETFARGGAPFKWLYLTGSPGVGKTRLGVCVINWRAANPAKGAAGKYCKVPVFLNELRDSYGDGSYRAVMDRYQRAGLLMLDDIGVQKESEWVNEQLYLLLDYRYENVMETIITSNRPISMFEARIADRLQSTRSGFCKPLTIQEASFR